VLPDGLTVIESSIKRDGERCFQLMETDDAALFDVWTAKWNDLVEFEIVAIEPSPAR